MGITVDQARAKAMKLVEADKWALRTCHECNPAHEHFTQWDDYVVNCFDCGRWWLGGIDVTIYEES